MVAKDWCWLRCQCWEWSHIAWIYALWKQSSVSDNYTIWRTSQSCLKLSIAWWILLKHTILSAKNAEVNEINTSILTSLSGDKTIYYSADSITEQEYQYIPLEFLYTLDPSGFSLHKLKLKIGAPLMLLWNLDHNHGLYNGIQMVLIGSTWHVLQCHVLRQEN